MASAVSTVVSVRVQLPAAHEVVDGAVAAPLIRGETVAVSPVKVPQVPPIVVTFVFVLCGKVRVIPFTVVTTTTGAVLSMVTVRATAVPLFPAVSVWVAVSVRVASVVIAGVRVRVHVPAEQVAVAGMVAIPAMRGVIVVESPVSVPHVPPIVVRLALVK